MLFCFRNQQKPADYGLMHATDWQDIRGKLGGEYQILPAPEDIKEIPLRRAIRNIVKEVFGDV